MTRFRLTLLCLFVLLSMSSLVLSHKESSQTLEGTGTYDIRFGFIPGIIVEGASQKFYLEVTTPKGATVSSLDATFTLFHDDLITLENVDKDYLTSRGLLIESYKAVETAPGVYTVSHIFPTKGPYLVLAELTEGGKEILSLSKHVHVEPNGPSTVFWLYMLLAVVTGFYLATKAHKV